MTPKFVWELFVTLCKAIRWLSGNRPKRGALLIVEDNQDDSDYLRSRLKRKGWDCEIASSGEVAQGLVKHQYYPICFVDMRLPGMSGQALVRLLSRDTPRTSVVIVCGEAADVVGVPEGIFVGLIKKPATLEAIEDMLVKLNV